MAKDAVRTFFDETLPKLLAETAQRGDAMRCTLRVAEVGEWLLDLRVPFQRLERVDPQNPPKPAKGCCAIDIEMAASDFADELASRGESLPMMVACRQIQISGDKKRGLLLLQALVQAPPLVWPPGLRFHAVDSAFFAATEGEVASAFADWKPATETWDPTKAVAPLEPPLPYRHYRPKYYWWESLVDFTRELVSSEDLKRRLSLTATGDELSEERDRAMDDVFPMVCWQGGAQIRRAPRELAAALAARGETIEDAKRGAPAWSFAELRPTAQAAMTEGRELWYWGRYPHWG